MNINIDKTLEALTLYASSEPHTKGSVRQLLKLTTIEGKVALECVPESTMSIFDWFASTLGFGGYKLNKITAFLNSVEFCTGLESKAIDPKIISKLETATTELAKGIKLHNNKLFRKTIHKNLDSLVTILNNKVHDVAKPLMNQTANPPASFETTKVEKVKATRTSELVILASKDLNAKRALSPVEQRFVQKFKQNLSPKEVHKLQIEAIQSLDENQQNTPAEITKAKQSALLKACGLSDPTWLNALTMLEGMYEEAKKEIPPATLPRTRDIPELAHKKLQTVLHKLANDSLDKLVGAFIAQLDTINPKTQLSQWTEIVKTLPSETKNVVQQCKELLEPQYAFYEKWGTYLKAEMIQGFENPDETLGEGICWALSLRWAIAELEKSPTLDSSDLVSGMKIGSSSERDRFNQAFLQVESEGIDSPQLQKIKKLHNIVKTHRFDWAANVKEENLKEVIRSNLTDGTLIANQGVGQLCFWWKNYAHAITICCQPDNYEPHNSVFRISDPNRGTFNFTVSAGEFQHNATLTKFTECLTDLLATFYSDSFKKISLFCFEQGSPRSSSKN